ncbi:ThiF family adenylyltransferase [Hansschlegelia quercus]|uniref:Thiamine biosynthesis protein ThiF n=1 Tax=Hansschlegelia quercus TaxID=2528245 RepID=A0A4Q9GRP3_9HYPH|nr:ThiF family adenylyltransferase [Hansschlegelia quercus]TBN54427.1 hypothetical protein EYR15_06235 [Hansschlegelia quercus]
MWRFGESEELGADDLNVPLAREFAAHVRDACGEFCRLVDCRRLDNGVEIVTFEIDIDLPQRPVYAILATERVSACFAPSNSGAPLVVVDREDFPDTPHQGLVFEGLPSLLCVDDRPWQDVRGGYTASELMSRIAIWFRKACEGDLHGADQPFDAFFGLDGDLDIIIQHDAQGAMAAGGELNVWSTDDRIRFLIMTTAPRKADLADTVGIHVLHVAVEPGAMRRIRRAPRTLQGLAVLLADRGVDLLDRLKTSVVEWTEAGGNAQNRKWVFCILVSMPQIHPLTGAVGATRPMAFLCHASPGEIGVAMGVLEANKSDAAREVSYVRVVGAMPSAEGLQALSVQIAPVHLELEAARSAIMAGRTEPDLRRIVMIGAGSLGSLLAENLAREGLFRWTVIDPDTFLPHNAARHTLTRDEFGKAKASELAARLLAIRADTAPEAICENVLALKEGNKTEPALDAADVILDCSASVPVSRWLSDRPGGARRLCAFFTPDGRAAVLMAESEDRAVNLRDVEAAYLREVLTNPSLEGHHRPSQQMRYTGACRALTNRIPASSVALLSSLIASALPEASSRTKATLKIWTLRGGGVDCVTASTASLRSKIGDWGITLPRSLAEELDRKRADALPNETGGPLIGMIDQEARHITVAHVLPPPPDSVASPTGFERGTDGLHRSIEEAQARSGGQVRYVGEWHSHPKGSSADPSVIDLAQIDQLSHLMKIDGLPAISLIAGEGEVGFLLGKAD